MMTSTLTTGQRALLKAALHERRRALDQAIARHQGGSRAEHAREVLLQDGDDAPQRDSDREVDLALTDREMVELGEVSRALLRVDTPQFGLCSDCGAEIPFDRLRLEPWALRCVTCQAVAEARP
jgi:RNA polymerase-binding protein DksA